MVDCDELVAERFPFGHGRHSGVTELLRYITSKSGRGMGRGGRRERIV